MNSSSRPTIFGIQNPVIVVLLGLAIAGFVTACSGSDSAVGPQSAPGPTSVPAPSGVSGDGLLLSLETVDAGSITGLITDHRGYAVYGALGETPDNLVCVNECTDVWIPLTPREWAVSDRLDLAQYGVMTRPDRTPQVTYRNVPLYLWTGDTEVGITQGSGVAGIWYVLTADGT